MATIAQIRAKFEDARERLATLDGKLAAEYRKIGNDAFDAGRPETEAEQKRRAEITAERDRIGKALQALSLSTLDDLSNASDLVALTAAIQRVNAQLDETLDRLEEIEGYAEDAAAVAKALAGLARGVASLGISIP
jgi:chaperonin cofactor prefoldin